MSIRQYGGSGQHSPAGPYLTSSPCPCCSASSASTFAQSRTKVSSALDQTFPPFDLLSSHLSASFLRRDCITVVFRRLGMGRGRLALKLIANEKCRKTTFLKRKKCLMRKAYELSTLCDVRTCVFVSGPNQIDGSSCEVQTWPPCRNDSEEMVSSYRAICFHKRPKKVSGLFDFFSDRKKMITADILKLRREIAETKYAKWDDHLDSLHEAQLRLLMADLDSKLDSVKRRIDFIAENREGTSGSHSQPEFFVEDQTQTSIFGNLNTETLIPLLPMDHHELEKSEKHSEPARAVYKETEVT